MFHYSKIGVHASNKGSLFFSAWFLRSGHLVMSVDGVIKIPFDALTTAYLIRLDNNAEKMNTLAIVL